MIKLHILNGFLKQIITTRYSRFITCFYLFSGVFHKNVQSYSLINTFSEHPIITGSTEFTDSKVNTSTDTLAITSSTDSKGETSSETALVTKKARKMHRERTTSTLGIPPSEVELIGMPPSVEILKTSDNILYDISTESYVKYKTKKRKLYNSLKNNFEEINVAETTTEGKRNLKSANRDPISHKILKEVWKTIQEYPSDANDKK